MAILDSIFGNMQDESDRHLAPGMGVQIIDGRIQTLLLAFAVAPALEELHMHFRNGLSITGKCLVSIHLTLFRLLPGSCENVCVHMFNTLCVSGVDGCTGATAHHICCRLLQVHVKLLGGLTKLHIRGISPPVTTHHLDSLFSALPALQVLQPQLAWHCLIARCLASYNPPVVVTHTLSCNPGM